MFVSVARDHDIWLSYINIKLPESGIYFKCKPETIEELVQISKDEKNTEVDTRIRG